MLRTTEKKKKIVQINHSSRKTTTKTSVVSRVMASHTNDGGNG